MKNKWQAHLTLRLRSGQASSGQAAIELAIFGSFFLLVLGVLVQYGLRANFEQNFKMRAFRKAVEESRNASMKPSEAHRVTYVVVRDKPIPDPSSPYAIPSRINLATSESGVFGNHFFIIPRYPSKTSELLLTSGQLPKVVYEINGRRLEFTTAAFKHCAYDESRPPRIKMYDDEEHSWGKWHWEDRYATDDFWKDVPEHGVSKKDELERGARSVMVDVDGDGEEELVLETDGAKKEYPVTIRESFNGEHVCVPTGVTIPSKHGRLAQLDKANSDDEWDCYWLEKRLTTEEKEGMTIEEYRVTDFYVMDYQEGQIDLTYEGPNGQRQGLQSGYGTHFKAGQSAKDGISASVARKEDKKKITNITDKNYSQDITRYIVVNKNFDGDIDIGNTEEDNIVVGFSEDDEDRYEVKTLFGEKGTLTWETPHGTPSLRTTLTARDIKNAMPSYDEEGRYERYSDVLNSLREQGVPDWRTPDGS